MNHRYTGEQIAQIVDALLSAYTSKSELEIMVRTGLSRNLDVIAGGHNLQEIVFSLVKWAERTGELHSLILEAQKCNPGNPEMQGLLNSYRSWNSAGKTKTKKKVNQNSISTSWITVTRTCASFVTVVAILATVLGFLGWIAIQNIIPNFMANTGTVQDMPNIAGDIPSIAQDMSDIIAQLPSLESKTEQSTPKTVDLGNTNLGAITGNIKYPWHFNAEAGDIIDIVATPFENKDSQLNLMLELLTPDQELLAEVDEEYKGKPEISQSLILPSTGQYTILVSSKYGGSGSYLLQVLTEMSKSVDTRKIKINDTIPTHLKPNEMQYWILQGNEGEVVDIVVEPSSQEVLGIDFVIELYAPNGQLMQDVDQTFSGDTEVLSSFTFDTTGNYTLWVYDRRLDSSGGYTISVQAPGDGPNGIMNLLERIGF